MSHQDDADNRIYVVVCNVEEQYSIWFQARELPAGWWTVGVQGSREECLAHIERVWTDITPLSARQALN